MKKLKNFFTKDNMIKGSFMLVGLALNTVLSLVLNAIFGVGIYNIETFRDYGLVTFSYFLFGIIFIYSYVFGLDRLNIQVKEYTNDKSTFEKGITKTFISFYVISCGWNPIIVSGIYLVLKLIPGFDYEFLFSFNLARVSCMVVSFLPFYLFIKWIDKLEAKEKEPKQVFKQDNTYPTFEELNEKELFDTQDCIDVSKTIIEDTLVSINVSGAKPKDVLKEIKSPFDDFKNTGNAS